MRFSEVIITFEEGTKIVTVHTILSFTLPFFETNLKKGTKDAFPQFAHQSQIDLLKHIVNE